jgi:hypothetical protein
MTLPPLAWKLIGGAVIAVMIGILFTSWMARGREIDRLNSWQTTVIGVTTDATVKPDAKGKRALLSAEAVPGAIAALKRSFDNADSTLAGISAQSLQDKALQRQLDQQLAAILAGQDKSAGASAATIRALVARVSTGDKGKDCELMDQDSNAAWDGWRK